MIIVILVIIQSLFLAFGILSNRKWGTYLVISVIAGLLNIFVSLK